MPLHAILQMSLSSLKTSYYLKYFIYYFIQYCVNCNTQPMFRKFWNNVLQTNQEYLASYVSNCKPRCLKSCTTKFTPEHLVSMPWVVGSSEVVPSTQQCTPTNSIFHQRIVVSTLYCCMSQILQICHLVIFSYSHDWNKLWKANTMLTFWPF